MGYKQNSVVTGESFAIIRENINNNNAYFKEQIDNIPKLISGNVVFGTYVGDGEPEQIIELGFRPVAVEVYRNDGNQRDDGYAYGGLAIDGYPTQFTTDKKSIEIVDQGFKVFKDSSVSYERVFTNYQNYIFYYKAYIHGTIRG